MQEKTQEIKFGGKKKCSGQALYNIFLYY